MKTFASLIMFSLVFSSPAFAQNIGVGTTNPICAKLEVSWPVDKLKKFGYIYFQ